LVIYSDGGITAIYDIYNDHFAVPVNNTGNYLSAQGATVNDYQFQNIADATFIVNTNRSTQTIDTPDGEGADIDSTRMPVKLTRTNSSHPFEWSIEFNDYTGRSYQEQCLSAGSGWSGTSGTTWGLKCPWTNESTSFIVGNASSTDVQEALQGNGKDPDDYDDAVVGLKAFPYGKVICTGGPIDHKRIFVRISPDIEADGLLSLRRVEDYPDINMDISRGHSDQNPPPKFISEGMPISDIGYYNNRMVLASDEFICFSASDDLFNHYLDDSAFLIDSDPIEAQLAATDITIIDFVVPFRQSVLIMTRAGQQFELSTQGEPLTPSTTSVTASTRYETQKVRPVSIGERLYFPGGGKRYSVIYEYFYDDMAVSNKAADITRHVHNYVPPVIVNMVTCTNTETLYVMPTLEGDVSGSTFTSYADGAWDDPGTWSDVGTTTPQEYDDVIISHVVEFDDYADEGSRDRAAGEGYEAAKLYVYQSYTEGQKRKQSAWGQWDFGADAFMDCAIIDTDLYMLRKETHTDAGTSTTRLFVDKIDTSGAEPKDAGNFTVHLDHRVSKTGGTKTGSETPWTVTWSLQGTVGDGFVDSGINTVVNTDTNQHATIAMAANGYDASATFAVEADATSFAAEKCIFGRSYSTELTLSKLFMRDDQGKAVVDGRTALKKSIVEHQTSGEYSITLTDSQDTSTERTKVFTPDVGTVSDYAEVGFWTHGNVENLTLKLINTDPRPCTWTSLEYHGVHTTTTE